MIDETPSDTRDDDAAEARYIYRHKEFLYMYS